MIKDFDSFIRESGPPGSYIFLGYHSSRRNNLEGFSTTEYYDEHFERVREVFMNSVPTSTEGYREAINDVDQMLFIMHSLDICVTFVSEDPIEGSNFQADRYKYGDNLYKVYADDYITILDDHAEIGALMVIYHESDPLYFEPIS